MPATNGIRPPIRATRAPTTGLASSWTTAFDDNKSPTRPPSSSLPPESFLDSDSNSDTKSMTIVYHFKCTSDPENMGNCSSSVKLYVAIHVTI